MDNSGQSFKNFTKLVMKQLYIQHRTSSRSTTWVKTTNLNDLENYEIHDDHVNIYIYFETKDLPTYIYVWGKINKNSFYERFSGFNRCLENIDDGYIRKHKGSKSSSSRSSCSKSSRSSCSKSSSSKSSSSKSCLSPTSSLHYLSNSISHNYKHCFKSAISYYSRKFDPILRKNISKIYHNCSLKNINNIFWYGFAHFLALLVLHKYSLAKPTVPLPSHWTELCCSQGFNYYSKTVNCSLKLNQNFTHIYSEAQSFMNLWIGMFKEGKYINSDEAILTANSDCLKSMLLLKDQLDDDNSDIITKIKNLPSLDDLQDLKLIVSNLHNDFLMLQSKVDNSLSDLKTKIDEELFRLGIMVFREQ